MTAARPITEDDLQAFIDNALDARRHTEVEAWLAAHPGVAERVAADIRVRDTLRAALQPIVEEPVPAELNVLRQWERRNRSSYDRRSGPWHVAAAILLLIAGGAGGWGLRDAQYPPRAGIAALASEASDSYAVYAGDLGRPVEIPAADAPQLVKWASNRLQRPVSIPDLSASGFEFIGGRLVPTPHGPAVLYIFDNGEGTRLALLSRNMKIDKEAPMRLENRGDLALVSWAKDGLGYSLVGPLDEAVLHPIADAARAQFDTA
ncbi:anti-sigma factor [Sphingopyxis sp. JAI128]|uniref:anti-sigma factor family protein n=1 Tax=Sphingopyxis sp. JAI128 TaxID=2723066 RepID=UPI00161EF603|nr:anti-sigma factor [Sphingopyxis sp. JAI128]MBB6425725.1 anti-sigma factor RsiW [Sphingopyxis sp. JAI128]